jgi:hypothetical protein
VEVTVWYRGSCTSKQLNGQGVRGKTSPVMNTAGTVSPANTEAEVSQRPEHDVGVLGSAEGVGPPVRSWGRGAHRGRERVSLTCEYTIKTAKNAAAK